MSRRKTRKDVIEVLQFAGCKNDEAIIELRALRAYLSSDKFHKDTTVQVDDVLRRLQPIFDATSEINAAVQPVLEEIAGEELEKRKKQIQPRVEAELYKGWIYYADPDRNVACSVGGVDTRIRIDGLRVFSPTGMVCDEGSHATIPDDAEEAHIEDVLLLLE